MEKEQSKFTEDMIVNSQPELKMLEAEKPALSYKSYREITE